MNILDQLADYARLRVRNAKEILPPDQIKYLADTFPQGNFAFENALKKPDIAFICECKKASPSKGLIAPESVSYTHLQNSVLKLSLDILFCHNISYIKASACLLYTSYPIFMEQVSIRFRYYLHQRSLK